MKKKPLLIGAIVALVVVVVLGILLAIARFGPQTDVRKISIVVPDGAPLLPFAGFAAGDSGNPATEGNYPFQDNVTAELGIPTTLHIVSGPDQLAAAIQNEQPEAAVVAINMAKKLYDDGKKYKIAAVTTWGLNEIVGTAELNSLADLKGKTLYTFGRNETPGVVLRALLTKEGVNFSESGASDGKDPADSVKLVELSTAQDIVAALAKTNHSDVFGLLPEPVASTYKEKTEGKADIRLDLQKIWKEQMGTESYPQSSLIIRADLLADGPNKAVYQKYFATLCGVMLTNSELATRDPETAMHILTNTFNSTMFANPEPAVDAITEGRIKFNIGILSQGFASTEEDRNSLEEYLQIVKENQAADEETGSVSSDGPIVDADFYANLTQ